MHPYVASGLLLGAEAEAEGPWVTVEPARRERCSGILRGHGSAMVYIDMGEIIASLGPTVMGPPHDPPHCATVRYSDEGIPRYIQVGA